MSRFALLLVVLLPPLLCSMHQGANPGDVVWQPGPKPALGGTIHGTVHNKTTGAPLKHATVKVVGGGQATQTDSQGRYVLTNVSPGTQTIKASLAGFRRKVKTVQVLSNEGVQVNFHLHPKSKVGS